MFDAAAMQAPETADSTALPEAYGLDRLEDIADEEWLPAVEVSSAAVGRKADHLLDTISFAEWDYFSNAGQVLQNPGNLLPLGTNYEVDLLRAEDQLFPVFAATLGELARFREYTWNERLPELPQNCEQQSLSLLLLDRISWSDLSANMAALMSHVGNRSAAIVFFGQEIPDDLRSWSVPILHLPDQRPSAQAIAVQMLFGGQDTYYADKGWLAANRLGHAPPETVGIDREKLGRIDQYVERAIRRKAIPGCQVLVAKSGQIIYDKTFGYFTYDKQQAVDHESIYDLASLTKAAATTLGVMRLEEEGKVDLAGRLREYLPAYQKTGLKYLRVRHLLAHHTGLQANLPIAHWLRQDDLFASSQSKDYPLAVSDNVYLKKGVREDLLAEVAEVRTARRQFFRYSDVNFILLQQLIEEQANAPLDDYLNKTFYEPLGLQRLLFRPGLVFPESEIVPTELDRRWRKELVRGEVHDESATLLGGVGGHAGLFGNARDLAALFQMLIQDGTYAGDRYLQAQTIKEFTKRNGYNYRAFGFDRLAGHSKSLRRYGASDNTFGHTGFTGTCVWADPEEDLIFIFLSNRIYPDKHNSKLQKLGLRERIHKIVYQSLDSFRQDV